MSKVIEIRRSNDSDNPVLGYMSYDSSYFRASSSADHTRRSEVESEEFKSQFQRKFGQSFNGSMETEILDSETYQERKENMNPRLKMFSP